MAAMFVAREYKRPMQRALPVIFTHPAMEIPTMTSFEHDVPPTGHRRVVRVATTCALVFACAAATNASPQPEPAPNQTPGQAGKTSLAGKRSPSHQHRP
jgi:hypothetical protein